MKNRQTPLFTLLFLILGLALVAFGIGYRVFVFEQAKTAVAEQAIRSVSVVQPSPGKLENNLSFPGKLEAYQSVPIYSRVNGYLKSWRKDIGAFVTEDEVLGEIESPEIDQQLMQAKSDLIAAKSQEKLAKITYERWLHLLADDAVSQQDVDQKLTELESRKAFTQVAQSNLRRAKVFAQYKSIPAPFAGMVTERNTDIGALVSASGGKPLFVIANMDKLRLYVNVPQIFKNDIQAGLAATITLPEFPGKIFHASVVRSSGSINENSGSVLVEIAMDNHAHELTAGGYANVTINLPSNHQLLRLPSSAVITRKDGVFLACVDQSQQVNFKSVQLGRDFGQEIEVIGEIGPDTLVINNPSETLVQGEKVKFVPIASTTDQKR
jgi:RND family efflux transporter MFP subunit